MQRGDLLTLGVGMEKRNKMKKYFKIMLLFVFVNFFFVQATECDSLQNLQIFYLHHAKRDILISGIGMLIAGGLFTGYYHTDQNIRNKEEIAFSVALALPTAFAIHSFIDMIQAFLIKDKSQKVCSDK